MKNQRKKSKRSIRQFFEEQIKILDVKQLWWLRYKQRGKRREQVDESIELLVNQTNKRIKIIANYRKKLRKSVAVLDSYILSLVDQVIDEMVLTTEAYPHNALLQAMFFEEKLCHQFFSVNRATQASDALQHIFIATPHYKEVFMPAIEGETVIQDARKLVLNFKHKRIIESLPIIDGNKKKLKSRLYEFFLDKFVEQIKQEVEPYMSTGYSALKEQGALIKPIAPNEYLKSIVTLIKHPERLFFVSNVACMTDKFGMVAHELADSSYRQFNYFAFHSKHEPTLTLCVVNTFNKEE